MKTWINQDVSKSIRWESTSRVIAQDSSLIFMKKSVRMIQVEMCHWFKMYDMIFVCKNSFHNHASVLDK